MSMLNFTIGPVMSADKVREIGAEQVPYFRTSEFSATMKENEKLMKEFAKADDDARVVFITGSGTASMEASVMNILTPADKVLVVNGGSFGQRFVDLCELYAIPHTVIKMKIGEQITAEMLKQYDGQDYTAFVLNVGETSTGVHYDIDLISKFCQRNHLFLLVDAISSFLADEFDMKQLGADVMITGSQKALACPPGISIIVLSPRAIERIERNNVRCMYLNLKDALRNGERGQTPFTPAVGILRQINYRLKEIERNGGVAAEIERTRNLAMDFRQKIAHLPLEPITKSPSNAVTALHPLNNSAFSIFETLKDEYGIWICPNGGDMRDTIFRVGHIGALTPENNSTLVTAFNELHNIGKL